MIRRPPTSTLFPYPTLSRSGSILPVAVAHGEGRAEFESPAAAAACAASGLVGFRYVNHDGSLASSYPANPSGDRKSTRLNSSHSQISYAVFCLNKKNIVPTT